MRILIVGLGFVGLNLALHLSQKYEVIVLSREPRSAIRRYFINIVKKKGLEYIVKPEINKKAVKEVLTKYKPDIVINCVGSLRGSYEELYVSNVKVPLEISNAILEYDTTTYMIHISSAYILGYHSDQVHEEDNYLDRNVLKPKTAYEKTKFECERLLYENVSRGLRLIILRPVMMLGRYCYHPESSCFIHVLRRLRYIPVTDIGLNILDIENLSIVIDCLLSKLDIIGNFEFMYVPGTYFTLTEILSAFSKALNIECSHVRIPLLRPLLSLFAPSIVRPYLKYIGTRFVSKKLSNYVENVVDDIYKIAHEQVEFLRKLRIV